MGRRNIKQDDAQKIPAYEYVGPDVERLYFPNINFAFRPKLLTDAQIVGILDRYPERMAKYFRLNQRSPPVGETLSPLSNEVETTEKE